LAAQAEETAATAATVATLASRLTLADVLRSLTVLVTLASMYALLVAGCVGGDALDKQQARSTARVAALEEIMDGADSDKIAKADAAAADAFDDALDTNKLEIGKDLSVKDLAPSTTSSSSSSDVADGTMDGDEAAEAEGENERRGGQLAAALGVPLSEARALLRAARDGDGDAKRRVVAALRSLSAAGGGAAAAGAVAEDGGGEADPEAALDEAAAGDTGPIASPASPAAAAAHPAAAAAARAAAAAARGAASPARGGPAALADRAARRARRRARGALSRFAALISREGRSRLAVVVLGWWQGMKEEHQVQLLHACPVGDAMPTVGSR